MKKTLKNIQKCIRMSEFTAVVVEGIHGDGFNQKFENLVFMFAEQERELTKNITSLQAEEQRILKRIDHLKTTERTLSEIERYLNYAKNLVKNAPIEGQTSL